MQRPACFCFLFKVFDQPGLGETDRVSVEQQQWDISGKSNAKKSNLFNIDEIKRTLFQLYTLHNTLLKSGGSKHNKKR